MRVPILYRASLGFLIRHPWQLLLALLGITIGVGVVLAVDVANSSARAAFTLSLDTLAGQSTHQITAEPGGVDERLYADLKTSGEEAAFAPVIDGRVEIQGVVLSVLGVDPLAERAFRSFTLPAVGSASGTETDVAEEFGRLRRFLVTDGAALLSGSTLAKLGMVVDGSYPLLANGRTHELTVVGELSDSGSQYADLLIVDIATAQEWFAMYGRLSRVDVRASEELAARLSRMLPPGSVLAPASLRKEDTTEMTAAFMTNLTAMSLLALLVGVFLIYNSVGFAVVQRRGLIGVLRALGLTREETFALILVESAFLAALGVLLGIFLGSALGERLLVLVAQSINDLYFRVAVTDVTVSVLSVAKAAGAGILVTFFAALSPAIEASGMQPALSLSRSTLEQRTYRALPWLGAAGAALALAGMSLLALSERSLAVGLIALFAVIFGLALCIPILVLGATTILTPLASRVASTPGRLAVDSIRTSLSRTGVAIVALAIAISATVGVSVMVDSFRDAVERWVTGTLQSDLYVGVAAGSLDPDIVADIATVRGVSEISTSRRVWIAGEHDRTRVIVLGMATGSYAGTELVDGDPEPAWTAFDENEAVLVSTTYAYRHEVAAGDTVELLTEQGKHPFLVSGVYRSYDANQGALLMSRATYDRHWSDPAVDSIGVYLEEGIDTAAVERDIRALSTGRQALSLASQRSLKETSLAIFDRTFIITNVLYWLAIGVAIIGILGAMLALQLERARELAVLRALGMTQRQLGGLVIGQTTVIGLLSGLAAVPLGLVMAALLIDVINRRSFGWEMSMIIDGTILGTSLLTALGAAMLAGVYPAWRAAQASPALAMREE